jgi:hypothetical protein
MRLGHYLYICPLAAGALKKMPKFMEIQGDVAHNIHKYICSKLKSVTDGT